MKLKLRLVDPSAILDEVDENLKPRARLLIRAFAHVCSRKCKEELEKRTKAA